MELIYDIWIYILVFITGAVFGSFLNVLILRSHDETPWWKGRSKCPKCAKELTAFELIPILSFIIQKGRCKGCNAKLSFQYPIVEITSALLALICYYIFGLTVAGFIIFIAAWLLLGDFVSDWLFMELPEIFNISLIFVAILYQIFVVKNEMISIVIGVAFGFLFFYTQYVLSKKKGIGEGDLRLGIIMGIFLGWPFTIYSILTSYVIATIIFLPMIALKKVGMKTAVPLGVFLIPVLLIYIIFRADIASIINTLFVLNL